VAVAASSIGLLVNAGLWLDRTAAPPRSNQQDRPLSQLSTAARSVVCPANQRQPLEAQCIEFRAGDSIIGCGYWKIRAHSHLQIKNQMTLEGVTELLSRGRVCREAVTGNSESVRDIVFALSVKSTFPYSRKLSLAFCFPPIHFHSTTFSLLSSNFV
jgi:hypothetical protein